MNKNICRSCKRFMKGKNDLTWWCAKELCLSISYVIPGHSYYEKNKFHPIKENQVNPPGWCEFALEQTVSESNDDLDLAKEKSIVFDGNDWSEYRRVKLIYKPNEFK